jgi:4-azaleucine resistance transporter AzlC
VRSELPIAIGVIPFGLIYGVLALGAGLPPAPALAMSSVVFAGSAQFIGQGLIGQGYPAVIIVLTTFVVNLRHLLYSASLAPYLKHLPARWQWGLAYLLTDEAYVTTIVNYQHPGEVTYKHWFFLGAGLTLWGVWQTSTAAGILLGAQVPANWGLDFTLALTFIGLVIPAFRGRADVAAALSAGLVALAAADLPLQLGLMLAALTGIVVGVVVEIRTPAKPSTVTTLDDRRPTTDHG